MLGLFNFRLQIECEQRSNTRGSDVQNGVYYRGYLFLMYIRRAEGWY